MRASESVRTFLLTTDSEPMSRTYTAVLHNDRIDWTGEAPNTSTPTHVRVVVDEHPEEKARRGERMAEALRALAELDPFRDIEDPAEWQREIRRDRPLPGRDGL